MMKKAFILPGKYFSFHIPSLSVLFTFYVFNGHAVECLESLGHGGDSFDNTDRQKDESSVCQRQEIFFLKLTTKIYDGLPLNLQKHETSYCGRTF